MSTMRAGGVRRLPCACANTDCTVVLEVETYPPTDTALLRIGSGAEYPFRLSELMTALQEYVVYEGPGQ